MSVSAQVALVPRNAQSPPQWKSVETAGALRVRVTTWPPRKVLLQVVIPTPQVNGGIPAGLADAVIVPVLLPGFVTVSENCGWNVAVTERLTVMRLLQPATPAQPCDQPVNRWPAAAVAVSGTEEP